MSELISGKEALNYAFDGVDVEYQVEGDFNWCNFNDESWAIDELKSKGFIFRLKPKTITLNNIEVPAPFEPKEGDTAWCISDDHGCGYCAYGWQKNHSVVIGAWRTEDEIKQVVSALRSVFKGGV
ncbi:MAG: hypothetical protein RSE18_07070 [Acinetobacter sp.]